MGIQTRNFLPAILFLLMQLLCYEADASQNILVISERKSGKIRGNQRARGVRLVGFVVKDNPALVNTKFTLRRNNINLQQTRNKKRQRLRVNNGKKNNRNRQFTKNVLSETIPPSVYTPSKINGLKETDYYEEGYYDYQQYYIETTRRRQRRTQTPTFSPFSPRATESSTVNAAFELKTITPPSIPPQPSAVCTKGTLYEAMICCNLRIPQILDYSHFDNCYTDVPAMTPQEIDTFTINLGMDNSSELNFNLKWFQDTVESMCVTHCMFLDSKFLENDPRIMNYNEINSYFEFNLEKNNESEWVPVLEKAQDDCESALSAKRLTPNVPDYFETNDSTCFTRPFLYIQCIRRELIFNCPIPSDKATTDDYCIKTLGTISDCNPFKT